MPNTLNPTPNERHAHGELACADAEVLLAEVTAENVRLRAELHSLSRRFENVVAQKNIAIDEAVEARSRY